jgi:hydroxymethylpyrimidine pyrophosphatase-like HAD family hydrolase
MKYKAVMLDFDGTVTALGKEYPSEKMARKLIEVAQTRPIAFCTGRQLESFVDHGLTHILNYASAEEREQVLSNIFLIAENGSMGYLYDSRKKAFSEFYRSEWPDSFIKKTELRHLLGEKTAEYGTLLDIHRVAIVVHAHNQIEGDASLNSRKTYEIVKDILRKTGKDFDDYLHIGDSGIGVIICPADGDKDNGIVRFAEFLRENRGLDIDDQAREILVVGDSPNRGGNDFFFLKGEFGSPYTVGNLDKDRSSPALVLDENNKPLLHDQGTLYILNHIF